MSEVKAYDLADLSILVSYYNKQNYLDQLFSCLTPLLTLNGKVHIIDDGSDEEAMAALCEKVEDLAPELRINLNLSFQSNMGSSATRNLLLDSVNTPYFIFLDADDIVISNVLVECLKWLSCSTADCLISPFSATEKTFPFPVSQNTAVLFRMKNQDLIYQALGYWRIIYRKSIFDEAVIRFLPGVRETRFKDFILDDCLFLIRFSSVAKELLLAPQEFSFYIYNPPPFSQESRANYRRQESIMPLAVNYYLEFYSRRGLEISDAERRMLWQNLNSCYRDLTPKSKLKFLLRFARSTIAVTQPVTLRDNVFVLLQRIALLLKALIQSL